MADNGTEPEGTGITEADAMRVLNSIVDTFRVAPKSVMLENGIELRIKPVSETALRVVVSRIPLPKVPMGDFGKDGEIKEPWPESPKYKAAMIDAMAARNKALAHACRVLGTECTTVPEGYFRPEDDGWIDALRIVGAEPTPDQLRTDMDRYSAWLDNHATTMFLDVNKITQAVLMRSAIMEEEVMEAIQFFRRNDIGPAPDGDDLAQDGHQDGSGVRTRGTGAGDRDGTARHGAGGSDTMGPVGSDGSGREDSGTGIRKSQAARKVPPKRRRRAGAKGPK